MDFMDFMFYYIVFLTCLIFLLAFYFAVKADAIKRKLETQELQRKLAEAETEEWREKMLDKVKKVVEACLKKVAKWNIISKRFCIFAKNKE